MSSIRLKKAYTHTRHGESIEHKAGEVISVPYGTGQELIARGVGVYASEPLVVEPVPVEAKPIEAKPVPAVSPVKKPEKKQLAEKEE